jgi:LAO/AO transport system kinase
MTGSSRIDIDQLANGLRNGDRRSLARAITLVESTRRDHRAAAEALLECVLPGPAGTVRLGFSGVPGVGKSTFIEAFGQHLIGAGHRVAVLAVDPSSKRGGGSILGDKTRMAELARNPGAFIRPSPTSGTLGGVARRTREAIVLCEAAGFDVIIVETVGVGQSETAVSDLVDMFVLLLLPGGGDELQGIKMGVVELADLIVVNKADGDLLDAARRTVAEYRSALRLLRPASRDWRTEVVEASALTGRGIDGVWKAIGRHQAAVASSGALQERRAEQVRQALWTELAEELVAALRADDAVTRLVPEVERRVMAGRASPSAAARDLLERFLGRRAP